MANNMMGTWSTAGMLECTWCKNKKPEVIEDYANGEYVCNTCGMVLSQVVDVRSEWRTFENDTGGEEKNRVGDVVNPFLDDSGLTTIVGRGSDSVSRSLSRIQNENAISQGDRGLLLLFEEMSRKAERLNLSYAVKERACEIYKILDEAKCMRGRSIDGVLTACLLIACRQQGVPRTLKEFTNLTTVSKRELGRYLKDIIRRTQVNIQAAGTSDFMSRYCSALNLSNTIEKVAKHVASRAHDAGAASGKTPPTIAAAAIYMVSQLTNEKRSYKDIAAVTGVAEQTIRNCYKDIYKSRDCVLPLPDYFKPVVPVTSLPSA